MNWIISYPRSGNTAARYILEALTKRPSDGLCFDSKPNKKDILQEPLIHKNSDEYAIKKGHNFKGVNDDDFVLFIIRDPLEATIRHNEKPRGLSEVKMKSYIDDWFNLLWQYHEHTGNKMIWYYDELVKIADRASKSIYPNPQSNAPDFHKFKLSDEVIGNLYDYMGYKYGFLVNEYLVDILLDGIPYE